MAAYRFFFYSFLISQKVKLSVIKINKGIDLPIDGKPEQKIELARASRSVGVIGSDFSGMKQLCMFRRGIK